MDVCTTHGHPPGGRKTDWSPCSWTSDGFWATVWVLRTKYKSSGRTLSTLNCLVISPGPAYSSQDNTVCLGISRSKFSPTKNTSPSSSQPFIHFETFQTLIWNRNAFVASFVLYRIVLTAKCVWGTCSQTSGSWVLESLDSFKVNSW